MKYSIRIVCIVAIIVSTLPVKMLGEEMDTAFTLEQFTWYLRNYHPIAQQAGLLTDKGESTIRKARGNFDPYLFGNLNQKYFDDKEYFSLLGGGLKVPTWYGIEIKSGFDQNRGVFLNPEDNVPAGGLWYAGISVPLGQGLFIDKRRAVLKKARLFAQSTEAEQQKIMNMLYFEAIKQYWKWVEAWSQLQVYEEGLILALVRFNAVKQSFLLGDKPAIDTLEAFIQVQNRQMSRNQSLLTYQNMTLELSNYLWFENNIPLTITDNLHPPLLENTKFLQSDIYDSLNTFLSQLDNHPDMRLYQYKLNTIAIEKRLRKEYLKPVINLHYNIINEPVGTDFANNLSTNNYKWGVTFGFPILLRKQRGDLQLVDLSLQETEFMQQQKLLEIQNKIKQYYNEQVNIRSQVTLCVNAINNYERLLQGEKQKFVIGESSLFLINSRETSLIEAELKLIHLRIKHNIAHIGMMWAAGQLYKE